MGLRSHCFLVSVVLLAGCGDSGTVIEKVVPASGTVTYQGQPLDHYRVTFMSTEGHRAAAGITDATGKFTLGTNTADDGAPAGKHKVAVVWAPSSTATAGQEAIVDNPAMLPKPKVAIPGKYNNPETSGISLEIPRSGSSDLKIELQ